MALISSALLSALERTLNATLQLDPAIGQRLARLHGKVICLEITGFDLRIYFIPTPEGLQLYGQIEGEPDCTLSGSLLALASLGLSDDKGAELFAGGVQVHGDAALAHRFGKILADLDIDWEEHLSRLIGDIPAHQAGKLYRHARQWAGKSRQTLELDLGEYLQEELRWLPLPEELDAFNAEVDELRDDAERLQARLERLQRTLS